MDYKRGVIDSFQYLKENLTLFTPDLVQYFIIFALSTLYYRFSGLAEVIQVYLNQGVLLNELVLQVLSINLVRILVSTIIFIFFTFVVGATVDTVKYDMMKEIVQGKRASLRTSWKNRDQFFLKVIILKIFVYLLAFILALCAALLAGTTLLFGVSDTTLGYVAFSLGILAFLFFKLLTLFRIPILFMDKNNRPDKALLKSIKLFVKEKGYVLSVGIILAFFFVLFTVLEAAFGTIFGLMQNILASKSAAVLGFFMISFVPFLIKLVYRLWAEIFLFVNYRSR